MSGIGPVEPGEDTYASDGPPDIPRGGPPARPTGRHRGIVAAATCAAALAAAASCFYATRPAPPPAPRPGQALSIGYLGAAPTAGSRHDAFSFTLALSVLAGPPITVERITQTSRALWVSTIPSTPFTTSRRSPRDILVVIHVSECQEVPRNPQFPFIDLTLANTLTTQRHSYLLGGRYATDLAGALGAACPATPLSPPAPAHLPPHARPHDRTGPNSARQP